MRYDAELPKSGYVTAKWVQRRYSISNSTMYAWIAQKRLPAMHPLGGRAKRFRVEELLDFEQRCMNGRA